MARASEEGTVSGAPANGAFVKIDGYCLRSDLAGVPTLEACTVEQRMHGPIYVLTTDNGTLVYVQEGLSFVREYAQALRIHQERLQKVRLQEFMRLAYIDDQLEIVQVVIQAEAQGQTPCH